MQCDQCNGVSRTQEPHASDRSTQNKMLLLQHLSIRHWHPQCQGQRHQQTKNGWLFFDLAFNFDFVHDFLIRNYHTTHYLTVSTAVWTDHLMKEQEGWFEATSWLVWILLHNFGQAVRANFGQTPSQQRATHWSNRINGDKNGIASKRNGKENVIPAKKTKTNCVLEGACVETKKIMRALPIFVPGTPRATWANSMFPDLSGKAPPNTDVSQRIWYTAFVQDHFLDLLARPQKPLNKISSCFWTSWEELSTRSLGKNSIEFYERSLCRFSWYL